MISSIMENKHNTSDETVNSSLECSYADPSKVETQNSKTCNVIFPITKGIKGDQ